jgi:hypothetical protein
MANNELIKTEQRMAKIDQVVGEYGLAAIEHLPTFTRGLTLAKAMKQLRELVNDEFMRDIMELCDSPLGFKTDRAEKGQKYDVATVKDAVIHCLLRGGSVVGNEFNIISGRCYLTKEFYERQVRGLVHDLRVIEHVPHSTGGGALVGMEATWVHAGRRDSLKCLKTDAGDARIAVRVNSGMGVDAILGKAYRKLYARIYRRVTGSSWLEAEAADEPDEDVVSVQEPEAVAEAVVDEPMQEDESEQSSVLDGIQSVLEAMDEILAVNQYQAHAMGLCRTDEEHAKLAEWCDWRREMIRESRGSRASVVD